MTTLLPVAEAQARLLALGRPLPAETLPLAQAAGRYAAEDAIARRSQPAADLSAMDGYAIRFADMPGPWRVVGESLPGRLPERALGPGEAARIFTGAALPQFGDTILIQEDAGRDGDALILSGDGPAAHGQFVRKAGNDFAAGAVVIARGERITAARIALSALAGQGSLSVGRLPRVALISTGDELVPPGAPVKGVQLPASNALMLAAMLGRSAHVTDLGIVRDDREAIAAAFENARDANVIVTTGGVSVGDHDLVKPALESLGAEIDFWKIAMKPGKPLMAGKLGDAVILALPGNPVSAFVTATLFLRPLIARLAGTADPLPRTHTARLGCDLTAGGTRAEYLRATWRDGAVVTVANQDSAALAGLAAAELLLLREPLAPPLAQGQECEVLLIA